MFFTCLPPTPSVRIIWLCVNVLGCAPSADWMCPGLNILRVLSSIYLYYEAFTCTGRLQDALARWALRFSFAFTECCGTSSADQAGVTQRDLPVSASLVLG